MIDTLITESKTLGKKLAQAQLKLACAESCTGGWVAKAITSIAGSAEWFDCGFVTYTNTSKQRMLGVQLETLAKFGAVSEETAIEMAEGALEHSGADISVSITGIAGPDGGTIEKPVGTVWFAFSRRSQQTRTQLKHFDGDRRDVRRQSVLFALTELQKII